MSGFPPDSSLPPAGGPSPGGYLPPEPPAAETSSTATLPWEDPAVGGIVGLFRTAWLFLKNPTEAYMRMPVDARVLKPVVYGVLFAWVGMAIAQFYRVAVGNPLLRMLPPGVVPPQLQQQLAARPLAIAAGLVLAPVVILIAMVIWSAILHLMLLVLGGAGAGFAATLRVVCYGATANVFQLVPVCGGVIGGLWAIVLEVVGLAAAHKTSTLKAAMAVLIPVVVCCVCVVAAIAIFGAAIAALASGWR